MPETVLDALVAGVVLIGVTLPPGLVSLRALKAEAPPLSRLAIASSLGLVLVLFALLLELFIGGPWLILPLTLVSLWLLKPDRALWESLRILAPELLAAMMLGSLALLANGGDVVQNADGLSVRVGFDVSDRAFYGTVAQELERAPIWRLENPSFAPAPLQYSYLPALAGVLVHRYAGVDPLVAFGTCLPAFGLFLTALSAAALAQSFGAALRQRVLCMILVSLGGDLSFLVPEVNSSWLERTRLFFVFHSFASESLFYNPWVFGVPLAFVTLLCLKILLDHPGPAMVVPAAVVLAALFQTKVFAFIPIWLAVTMVALITRNLRLGAVAALSSLLASPGMALVARSEGVRGGAPLAIEPFALVRETIAMNPSLERLVAPVGLAAGIALMLLGGFGLRLIGVPELLRQARAPRGEAARLFLLTMVLAVCLALIFVGRPTRSEGVQFMFLPHALLWIFAGPVLGRMSQGSRLAGFGAALMLGLSVVTPIRYLAMKVAPDRLTASGSMDNRRFVLSATTISAARWLRTHSRPEERLVLPLFGDPEDRGGLKPLYVGLLASRRLVGDAVLFHVSPQLAQERQAAIQRLYETTDRAEGEELLQKLGVAWIWEDLERRLLFQSPRLISSAEFGRTRLVRFASIP